MGVGYSKCLGCGKEFKWKRTTNIPAKWCSRNCQKIRENVLETCSVCGKEYTWRKGKHKNQSRFCSRKCQYATTHEWVSKAKTFWNTATKDEKFLRMKILYEKHVIKQEGCWDWKGVIHHSGYAPLRIENKQTMAHVVSWMIYFGEIPENFCVCHKCDNRKCSNPEHLFLGTHKENSQDCLKKDRVGNAKLKVKDVMEIKKLLNSGVKGSEISKKFNVTNTAISYIKTGKQWTNIIPGD